MKNVVKWKLNFQEFLREILWNASDTTYEMDIFSSQFCLIVRVETFHLTSNEWCLSHLVEIHFWLVKMGGNVDLDAILTPWTGWKFDFYEFFGVFTTTSSNPRRLERKLSLSSLQVSSSSYQTLITDLSYTSTPINHSIYSYTLFNSNYQQNHKPKNERVFRQFSSPKKYSNIINAFPQNSSAGDFRFKQIFFCSNPNKKIRIFLLSQISNSLQEKLKHTALVFRSDCEKNI